MMSKSVIWPIKFQDYEKLEKSMVDAFVMTLMLFPRTPQETQQYREFKDKMKEYSHQKVYSTYKSSDNAPLTVQVKCLNG